MPQLQQHFSLTENGTLVKKSAHNPRKDLTFDMNSSRVPSMPYIQKERRKGIRYAKLHNIY